MVGAQPSLKGVVAVMANEVVVSAETFQVVSIRGAGDLIPVLRAKPSIGSDAGGSGIVDLTISFTVCGRVPGKYEAPVRQRGDARVVVG